MKLIIIISALTILNNSSHAQESSRPATQYYYRTPSRMSYSVNHAYQTPRHRRRHSAATSSFDWSETVGRSRSGTFASSDRSFGSTLSSTFDSWSQSMSSMFSGPRVHQMRSRCTPEDIPQSESSFMDTNMIMRGIVARALDCDPQYGSTETFKACLATRFPDLAPSASCYDCINEFVDKFRPHCPSRSDSCVKKTTKDLWDICSP